MKEKIKEQKREKERKKSETDMERMRDGVFCSRGEVVEREK